MNLSYTFIPVGRSLSSVDSLGSVLAPIPHFQNNQIDPFPQESVRSHIFPLDDASRIYEGWWRT